MEEYIVKDRFKQIALIGLAAASIFMATMDYSMLNISLPDIARYFNAKLITVAWVPLSYLVVITSLLLGFGKLGDIKGYRKMFILGIGVFVCGTFMCSLSPKISSVLISRVVQSVGEAMYAPAAIALITTLLPVELRGKALGIMALAQGVGLSIGPIMGGLINTYMGWRPIFLINIPVGLVVIMLAKRLLPSEQSSPRDKRFDIIGAVLIFIALSTFIFALNSVTKLGLGSVLVLGCFAVSVVSMIAFIITEKRISYPVLDMGLFRDRDFRFSGLSAFLSVFVYMGMYFIFPFYLELVRGIPVAKAGVVLMFPPLMMMIISPFSGRLSDLTGSRIPCSVGMAFATTGAVMLTFLGKDTPFSYVVACQLVMGVAMGMFLAPNNRLVMISAPADKQGVASGVYKTMINIGSSVGLAASPIILMRTVYAEALRLKIPISSIKDDPAVMMKGFNAVFIFMVFVCLLSLVFSLIARDKR